MSTRLRWQLPNNVFAQLLAGPAEVREGLMGFMLRLISRISLVGGPVLLLVFFELQLLPYHDSAVSWWQRVAVVSELALVWMLWPSIARGEPVALAWRAVTRRNIAAWGVVSLAPVLLVFTIATFPGELLDNNPANPATFRFIPTKWPDWNSPAAATAVRLAVVTASSSTTSSRSSVGPGDRSPVATNRRFFERVVAATKSMGWISPHSWLVAGTVDLGTRKPGSLFSNRLVLPDLDALDHGTFDSEAKLAGVSETVSLRMRDLRGLDGSGARFSYLR
jgi:hypothetical protein